MPGRKALGFVCLISCTACLAAGYARLGLWPTLAVALAAFLTGLSAWKWSSSWLPTLALGIIICLAAAGVLSGALSFFMIVCATLGLASWDLALLDRDPLNTTSWEKATWLETKHHASLALALGAGLLAAVALRLIRFQIPFVVMLLLVILVLFSLNQVWNLLTGGSVRKS